MLKILILIIHNGALKFISNVFFCFDFSIKNEKTISNSKITKNKMLKNNLRHLRDGNTISF